MGSINFLKLLVDHLSKQHAIDKPGNVKYFPRELKILRKIVANAMIQTQATGCEARMLPLCYAAPSLI